ncbi:MAG: hypothetical protein RMJ98_19255 [Myxococcales bacterium]|nr:hypothetical protein [Polyangiaceae bacterium]MDW8251438.1 hypothetical protein [Myxococcales bacterium]
MQRWKVFPWLAVLLLIGCMAEATSPEGGTTPEELQQQGFSQVGGEVEAESPADPQTTASPLWNPNVTVMTAPGGKPQPDPWRDRATTSGPNKPQPDPWFPLDSSVQHIK